MSSPDNKSDIGNVNEVGKASEGQSVSELAADLGFSRSPEQSTALHLDVSLYERYVADSDMTEAQKQEFLQSLWSIITSFVDLGFGIHPLQQSGTEACGQISDLRTLLDEDMISSTMPSPPSSPSQTGEFEAAAAARKEEA
ncbi:MAG: hypothetical protein AAF903_09145 [Pseudomonadota bacterium]